MIGCKDCAHVKVSENGFPNMSLCLHPEGVSSDTTDFLAGEIVSTPPAIAFMRIREDACGPLAKLFEQAT